MKLYIFSLSDQLQENWELFVHIRKLFILKYYRSRNIFIYRVTQVHITLVNNKKKNSYNKWKPKKHLYEEFIHTVSTILSIREIWNIGHEHKNLAFWLIFDITSRTILVYVYSYNLGRDFANVLRILRFTFHLYGSLKNSLLNF